MLWGRKVHGYSLWEDLLPRATTVHLLLVERVLPTLGQESADAAVACTVGGAQ